MHLAAIASTVLGFLRLAPNAPDFISALSLNNGKTMLEHRSSPEADERLRLLRSVRLKIGDTDAGSHIGRSVISDKT